MYDILKKSIEYFTRGLAFLLIRLFLWIPLLFVVCFFVSGLIFEFTLKDNLGYFLLGAGVSAALSAALAVYSFIKRPKRKKKTLKAQRSSYLTEDAHVYADKTRGVSEQFAAAPSREPVYQETVDERPQIDPETPLLYRTYSDPTIIIAEFPDRYEYYKKTPLGVIFIDSERK